MLLDGMPSAKKKIEKIKEVEGIWKDIYT